MTFTKSTIVYSAGVEAKVVMDIRTERIRNKDKWEEIVLFKAGNVNIIEMVIGGYHALFLDEAGTVWACGKSTQLGMCELDEDSVVIPTEIKYFVEHCIVLQEIAAGYQHSLAIDSNS